MNSVDIRRLAHKSSKCKLSPQFPESFLYRNITRYSIRKTTLERDISTLFTVTDFSVAATAMWYSPKSASV